MSRGNAGLVRDGVEWSEAPSSPIEDDDVLEIGPRSDTKAWNRSIARWRRRWPRLAAATVIAVGVVTYTAVRYSSSNRPPPHPVTNSLIPSVNESSHDVALAMVQAQAAQTEPLADIIRPVSTAGACPVVEPGRSPPHAIAAAARRTLPTFTVRDVARTLDQYLGMCAIELRGRDAAGSVFVFDIVAPERDTVRQRTPSSSVASSLASRRDGAAVITSMTVVTTTGWTVVVGCVGAVADQPDSDTLLRLGQDPALHW